MARVGPQRHGGKRINSEAISVKYCERLILLCRFITLKIAVARRLNELCVCCGSALLCSLVPTPKLDSLSSLQWLINYTNIVLDVVHFMR